jgi:putative MATE family efflux protein
MVIAGTNEGKKLRLFTLTWPLFIEVFLHNLMGSSDTFMLASISDDAVAAIGLCNQLVFFTILLFEIVATGTSIFISQYLGAGKREDAKQAAVVSISLSLILGIVVCLLVTGLREHFLNLFSLSAQVQQYADTYLSIVGVTLFTQAVLVTISAVLRSYGFTRDGMNVSIAMNLIHVIGNALFIYGLLGVPQLGVTGVAISTSVSRTLAVVLIFIVLYRRIPIRIQGRDYFHWNMTHIKKILKIGLPSAGEAIAFQTSQFMTTGFVALLGTTALATRIYWINIISFVMLFGFAVGQGTQIIIGHMVGAKQNDAAYRQLMISLRISLLVTLGVVSIVALFRGPLFSIFTDNQDIITMGGTLLLISLIMEPGRSFNLVVNNSLRAAGDAQFPVAMGIISMWGISVPLAYFFGIYLGYGLIGIWLAFTIDEWVRGTMMFFRWKSRVWEHKKLVDDAPSLPTQS